MLIVVLLALARVTAIVLRGPIMKRISACRHLLKSRFSRDKLTGRLVAEEDRSCLQADTVAADTRRTVAALEEDSTTWHEVTGGVCFLCGDTNKKGKKSNGREGEMQAGRTAAVGDGESEAAKY